MAKPPPLEALFAELGWRLDRDLIETALTHPGAMTPARPHYERLEFLGDRVLGLIVAEALLEHFPNDAEGKLAPRYNALVRKETCAEIADEIALGPHIRLEKSDARQGGRRRVGTLGDAMEAVIAAVYIQHGFEAARDMVMRLWGPRIAAQGAEAPRDAKSTLQEWAEGRGLAKPDYLLIGREGPDHAPRFEVEARIATGQAARAAAGSKREAEKLAAAALLEILKS